MCVCAFFFLFLEIGLEQARSGQAGPVSQTDRQTVNIHNKMQQTSKAKYDSVSAVGEYNIANSINVTRFDYNMEHMRIMRLPSFVRCFFVFCVFFFLILYIIFFALLVGCLCKNVRALLYYQCLNKRTEITRRNTTNYLGSFVNQKRLVSFLSFHMFFITLAFFFASIF